MKPRAFEYARPASLDDAVSLLASSSRAATLIAGGQSLMPMMNMRLASPDLLIDIAHLPELNGISEADGVVQIGAATRYVQIERSALVKAKLPLLPKALTHVAHIAIRNRGTLGGSLAFADPAAEMPACALALDAVIVARGPSGQRRIGIDDFLCGVWETALAPDEILERVDYPCSAVPPRIVFLEYARRHGDFAIAGAILVCHPGWKSRAVVFGFGSRAARIRSVEAWLDTPVSQRPPPHDVRRRFLDEIHAVHDGVPDIDFRSDIAATLMIRAASQLNEPPARAA